MALRTLRIVFVVLFPVLAAGQTTPYTIPVSVNEVNLTFSAADANGLPMNDLQLSELRLLDNGKKPTRILSFQRRTDLQIRAGIMMDVSGSMSALLPRDQRIVSALSTHILRQNSDQAFITRFDFDSRLMQDWTSNSDTLIASLHKVPEYLNSRLGGTAIFDALYIACRDQFSNSSPSATGKSNFILLFTDGIDNASHARMQDVIDISQRTHTAIYVFSATIKPSHDPGQRLLQELAKQSGGRIFYNRGDKEDINNLRIIEQDLRDDYILVYKPAQLKPDGSFHHVKLTSPQRAAVINTRSGYYAPH
jgi:Ca-activated chloride channel family protein